MFCNSFGEYKFWFSDSLQSRCKFGRWVLSIFLEKTMAAIFNFNGSARLGKDRNLCQRGEQWSKIRRGVGWGGENYSPFPAPSSHCCLYFQIKHDRLSKRLWASNIALTGCLHCRLIFSDGRFSNVCHNTLSKMWENIQSGENNKIQLRKKLVHLW